MKREVLNVLKGVMMFLASLLSMLLLYKLMNRVPPRISEVPYFRIEVWEVRGKWMF